MAGTTFATLPLTAANSGNGTAPSVEGQSSKNQAGTQGTTVGVIWVCREPSAVVTFQNNDATASNTVAWAKNLPTVAVGTGIVLAGAGAIHTIFMLKGDVLYAVAAADRAIATDVAPGAGF